MPRSGWQNTGIATPETALCYTACCAMECRSAVRGATVSERPVIFIIQIMRFSCDPGVGSILKCAVRVTDWGGGRWVDTPWWGMRREPDPHYRHRFPAELISHAVWLYHTFCLSFRNVELLLAERGVVVSYETIRRWCCKFPRPSPTGCAVGGHGPAIHVTAAGSAIPLRTWPHIPALPPTSTSPERFGVSHLLG
jgi:hypothetical protein